MSQKFSDCLHILDFTCHYQGRSAICNSELRIRDEGVSVNNPVVSRMHVAWADPPREAMLFRSITRMRGFTVDTCGYSVGVTSLRVPQWACADSPLGTTDPLWIGF